MLYSQQSAGYKTVRRDRLIQEQEHDAYRIKGKLREPTTCPECGAVYHEGRWQWKAVPDGAMKHPCPACMRIHDHFPAGYLMLSGDFFDTHRNEIMSLLHHVEQQERTEHPLKRIMDTENSEGVTTIATTDIHLARMMGEAVHHAYQGELGFRYNAQQNLLRVTWRR